MWKLRMSVTALVAALVFVGGAVAAGGGTNGGTSGGDVTGSWLVTVDRGPALPVLSSLQSFAEGGVVVETANTVGNRGPSHGVWKTLGNRLYATTIVFFRFDADGAFIGSQKINRTLRLSRDGNSFVAVSISQLLDPSGNVIPTPFPLRATEIAKRMEIERIPDVP
jgi:hypothetical protein